MHCWENNAWRDDSQTGACKHFNTNTNTYINTNTNSNIYTNTPNNDKTRTIHSINTSSTYMHLLRRQLCTWATKFGRSTG